LGILEGGLQPLSPKNILNSHLLFEKADNLSSEYSVLSNTMKVRSRI
jgi:hypothetical protein